MLLTTLAVLLASLVANLVSEFVSYMFLYRTENYQRLKRSIDSLQAKIEKRKREAAGSAVSSKKGGRQKNLEEQLAARNQDMQMVRMKSQAFVMVTLLGIYQILSNVFAGVVVAKLPFLPFPLIRSMSHRNLPGTDFTDCSIFFLYALCSLSLRPNIQRFFGFAPKDGPSSMFPTPPSSD